jgi:hypothetical protein
LAALAERLAALPEDVMSALAALVADARDARRREAPAAVEAALDGEGGGGQDVT